MSNLNETKTGSEDSPKPLLEVVTQINKDHKMISKATDEIRLKKAEEEITAGILSITTRIDAIRVQGKAETDVAIQRDLYNEYEKLKEQRDRLDTKLKAIHKKRTELTDKQKDFFGISKEPEGVEPSSTNSE